MQNDLENIFYPKVKIVSNNTRKITYTPTSSKKSSFQKASATKLLSKVKLIVEKKPEVMVKVTGFSKGSKSAAENLRYVSRNGQVELENQNGEVSTNKEETEDFINSWKQDFKTHEGHKNRRDTMHLVMSMPEGTNEQAVKNAVREFASEKFQKHDYLMALHTDTNHPHVHLIVKCKGQDKRLNPRKTDIQNWREAFAEKLLEEGVECCASKRLARGRIQRSKDQDLIHLEKRKTSKIEALRVNEVVQRIEGKRPQNENIKEIKKTYEEIQTSWYQLSESMSKSDPIFAKKIKTYADNMDFTTQNEILQKSLINKFGIENKEVKNEEKMNIEETRTKNKDIER